jgi:GT2 family glycosyltransferase
MQDPYPGYKVHVIDNASPDNAVEIVEREFPQVRIIKNRKNYGFAEGHNIGIRDALSKNAEYVVLLNQDIVAHPFWLTRLIEVAIKNPEFEAFSPITFDYEGHNIDPLSMRKLTHNKEFRDVDYPNNNFQDKVYEVPSLFGTALFFHKSIFLKVGLFDPLYFLYHEESDFFQRASYHKKRMAIATSSKINHWHTSLHPEEIGFFVKYLNHRNYFLVRLKDPNHTILNNFVNVLRTGIQNIWKSESFYGKTKTTCLISSIFFILFLRLPQILYKRSKEKKCPMYL